MAATCDECGYDRTGLPADGLCPECGHDPPVVDTAGRSANDAAWLRTVAVGLLLLLLSSYYAFQVAVLMPVGSFAVSAVNFPGPKVHGVVMIQRELHGSPGPLGVTGMIAALMGLAGVWLLTAPRAVGGTRIEEPGRAIRLATRWTAVVTGGAVMGGLLDFNGGMLPPMQNFAGGQILAALAVCELPANFMLYIHLRRLCGRIRARRAMFPLVVCSWAVPAVIFVGGLIQFGQLTREDTQDWQWIKGPMTDPQRAWTTATAVYGVAAVATSAAATAAVVQLFAAAATAGFGAWVGQLTNAAVSVPRLIRRAYAVIDADLPRWGAIFGLVAWLVLLPWNASNLLGGSIRRGLLGDVPLINFIGPVVTAPRVSFQRYDFESAFESDGAVACLLTLAVVWLMTGFKAKTWRWTGPTARWWATCAVAAPIGILLGMYSTENDRITHPTTWRVAELLAGELPATLLLYLHLSALAKDADVAWMSRRLRILAVALPVVIILPMIALPLSRPMIGHWKSARLTGFAAAELTAATALTFLSAAAIATLAWTLARPLPEASRARNVPAE